MSSIAEMLGIPSLEKTRNMPSISSVILSGKSSFTIRSSNPKCLPPPPLSSIIFHNPNTMTQQQTQMQARIQRFLGRTKGVARKWKERVVRQALKEKEAYKQRLAAYKKQMKKLETTGVTKQRLKQLQKRADEYTKKHGLPRIKIRYGQFMMFFDDPKIHGTYAITVPAKTFNLAGFYHELGHWKDFVKRGKTAKWEKRLRTKMRYEPEFETPERRKWLVAEERRAWEAVPEEVLTPEARWRRRFGLETYIKPRGTLTVVRED